MAADALDRVTRAAYRTLQERSTAETAPRLPAKPAYLAAGFAVLMLTGATLWEATVYFGRQAHSLAVERGFNPTENSVAREVIAALQADQEIYLSPRFSTYSPLRFLMYGVVKSQTGASTLDNPPYHVVLPEVNFPLPDTGRDVLILLDNNYWPLRDFLTSIYPEAKIELQTLTDDSPIYIRMEIPHEQIAALQGLTETITYANGRTEDRAVTEVKMDVDGQQISEIRWAGAIRIEHGGEYELKGEGGLDIFVDGLPVSGKNTLVAGYTTWSRYGMQEITGMCNYSGVLQTRNSHRCQLAHCSGCPKDNTACSPHTGITPIGKMLPRSISSLHF